jgi:hypothetical protein
MSLIDERGRLFGKVNLIDAIVGVVALGLIPLAYGAFLLFRVPAPTITTIAPAQVVAHQGGTVQITGTDLRPFLTARLGTFPVTGFLIQSPTLAEIKLPDLPPGSYDLTLADQGQELAVKPGALTVVAPPSAPSSQIELQAVGAFTGLAEGEASTIVAGMKLGGPQTGAAQTPVAEVIAVRPPEPGRVRVKTGATSFITATVPGAMRMPAVLRLTCSVVNGDCKVGDVVVTPSAALGFAWPSSGGAAPTKTGQLTFSIDEVRPGDMRAAFPTIATVRVRFAAGPEVLAVIKAGDVDVGGSGGAVDADRAVLMAVGSDRQTMTGQAGTELLLRRSLSLDLQVVAFTATLRVPLILTPSGWSYNDRPVKVGASFPFETMAGAMFGWVLDMKLDQPGQNVAK